MAQFDPGIRGRKAPLDAAALGVARRLPRRYFLPQLLDRGDPAERAWEQFPSVADALENAPDPDAARLKLRSMLKQIIESVWVLIVRKGAIRFCAVQCYFVGGGRRDYLIVHRTAGFRRVERWQAFSLPDVVKPGDFDLRKPADVTDLEKILQDVNPQDGQVE
jgi:hypothetical protein